MNQSIAPFVKRFLSYYLPTVRGSSPNTIEAYRDALKLLLCYASDTIPKPIDELWVEDITESLVLDFLEYLEEQRHCCASTRNYRLAAIKSLFTFIARQVPELIVQCQQIRAIPKKRSKHKIVNYLEEKEMLGVLNAIDINARSGIRDFALLQLLYNTGARVSEIVNLKQEDLQLNTATAQVKLLGKGKKERYCLLWPETVIALKDYLQVRSPVNTQAENIFLNSKGYPITRFGIRHITRKWGLKALSPNETVKHLNPHMVRHTCVMHLLRSGNEINTVSFWMGHANINTTHQYAQIDMDMKIKMLEKAGAPLVSEKPKWQQPDILEWLTALNKRPELCAADRE